MRHRVKGRKLNRTESHRKALLRALTTSLFKHKRIRTTVAKAKETRTFAETLITKARKNDVHSRRQIISELHDKSVVNELFGDIVQKIGNRPGGYTRVIKLGNRKGDAADMAIIELVDFNEAMKTKEEEKKEQKNVKEAKKKEKKSAEAEPEIEDAKIVEEKVTSEKTKKRGRKKKKDEEETQEKPKKRGRRKKKEE